ncbi:MAG: hypothetical protein E5Y63_10810 [Mesorhizobium sp.]|uniref:hypothetical protein n=1 Tax=Mesorhizobium sp. TaxID=1871066 RepID=UPI001206D09C|nr:hypothetical protein [Mesorhizobium sp.]TIM30686.1 MAG: hypothetical protein E5Y63_10810 [Mesorhizobium sp.]
MSADCQRPTLTFPQSAYNATQVRLYGISPNGSELLLPGQEKSISGDEFDISVKSTTLDLSNNEKIKAQIENISQSGKLTHGQVANLIAKNPSGFLDGIGYATQISLDIRKFGLIVISSVISIDEMLKQEAALSCGIIVGYSYEGHCYDLPKPKIMLIPSAPQPIPFDDCGYDKKFDRSDPASADNYLLWIVDKLDECVEFEINQGFVEQIVLEANLPGKRSPTMYASRMMMGHRGGRLGD